MQTLSGMCPLSHWHRGSCSSRALPVTISGMRSLTRLGVPSRALQNLENSGLQCPWSVSGGQTGFSGMCAMLGVHWVFCLNKEPPTQNMSENYWISRCLLWFTFIPSLNKYLLNTCCVPGTIVKETMVSKNQISLCNVSYNLKSGAMALHRQFDLGHRDHILRWAIRTHSFAHINFLFSDCLTSSGELESWLVNIWCSRSPKVLKIRAFHNWE